MNLGLQWLPQSRELRKAPPIALGALRSWDKAASLLGADGNSPSPTEPELELTLDVGLSRMQRVGRPLDTFFLCYFYFPREPQKGECSPDFSSFPWSLYQINM
jgi:hypothetical protein